MAFIGGKWPRTEGSLRLLLDRVPVKLNKQAIYINHAAMMMAARDMGSYNSTVRRETKTKVMINITFHFARPGVDAS